MVCSGYPGGASSGDRKDEKVLSGNEAGLGQIGE